MEKDFIQELLDSGYKPVIVGPENFSSDEILRNRCPLPPEEVEKFVEEIYADRRKYAGDRPEE